MSIGSKLVRNGRERFAVGKGFVKPSLTKQSFVQECDINSIMKKFLKTGLVEHVNRYNGNYGDFTELPVDYQEAMNIVLRADEVFMSLPAGIRSRFGNDPQGFLQFVSDPKNEREMIELGLAKPRPPAPPEPPAVDPKPE